MNNQELSNPVWCGDFFNRKVESDYLLEALGNLYERGGVSARKSLVLAINAEWGAGKSFFMKNFALELESAGHPVIHFDAWENDFSEDPLLSFLAELTEQLKGKLPTQDRLVNDFKGAAVNVVKAVSKVALNAIVKKAVGETLDAIVGDVKAAKEEEGSETDGKVADAITAAIFEDHKNKKDAIVAFKKSLRVLFEAVRDDISGKSLPIFVMIDELDRCRPDFSIKLLEGIKHIFSVEGVYFVLAINQIQLQESVKVLYGDSFNSGSYLKRFFDMEYQLTSPGGVGFVESLIKKNGYPSNDPRLLCIGTVSQLDFLTYMFDCMSLALRDQEQVAFQLFAICDALKKEHEKIFFMFLALLVAAKHLGMDVSDFRSIGDRLKIICEVKKRLVLFKPDQRMHYSQQLPEVEMNIYELFEYHANYFNVMAADSGAHSVEGVLGLYIVQAYPSGWSGRGPVSYFSNYPTIVKRAGLAVASE